MVESFNENKNTDYSRTAETAAEKALQLHGKFLASLLAGAIGIGIILPEIGWVIDVLWCISISLAAVTTVICLLGKKTAEVVSLPVVILSAVFLRFLVLVNSVKYILADHMPTTLQQITANIFGGQSGFLLLVLPAAGVLCLFAIIKACGIIAKKTESFTLELLPLKNSVIESKRNIGILDDSSYEKVKAELEIDGRFYFSMLSLVKLFKAEVVAGVVVVFVITTASGVLGMLKEEFSELYYTKASGTTAVYLLHVLITAITSVLLVGRLFTVSSSFGFEDHQQSKNKDDHLLVNPDFKDAKKHPNDSKIIQKEVQIKEAEFEAEKESFENLRKWTEKHYSKMAETLLKLGKENSKIVILASDSYLNLPVNIPVNLAIKLASSKRKCLLLDMDRSRNAIEKVFSNDQENHTETKNMVTETCINNVWIYREKPESNMQKFDDVSSEFDHVVIYAPNIEKAMESKGFKEKINSALLFDSDQNIIDDARKELKQAGVKVINIKNKT